MLFYGILINSILSIIFRENFSAEVAELADAQVSEACAVRLVGSNPTFRTILLNFHKGKFKVLEFTMPIFFYEKYGAT